MRSRGSRRNRIHAAFAPWVAARQSSRCEHATAHSAVACNGFARVFRTRRVEPACGRKKGRNPPAVAGNQGQERRAQRRGGTRSHVTITSYLRSFAVELVARNERSLDVVLDLGGAGFDNRRLRDQDDPNVTIIPSGSDAACGLAQDPLRAISFYGAADFAASHDTDANSIGRFGGMEKHDRVTGNELLSGIVAATKLPSVRQGSQASPLRMRPAAVWARRILRAQRSVSLAFATRPTACGPWYGVASERDGHHACSCVCGNRARVCV